jgi:hypothetical protein
MMGETNNAYRNSVENLLLNAHFPDRERIGYKDEEAGGLFSGSCSREGSDTDVV